MTEKKQPVPVITLIVSCSIFPEQLSAFMRRIEESADLEQVELILVARRGHDYRSVARAAFQAVDAVFIDAGATLNAARAQAVRRAHADIILFAEDHGHLHGPWVQHLPSLYRDPAVSAVAWTIRPGNLKTIASWTGFLVEYGWWGPGVPDGTKLSHLPGHNCSYHRSRLMDLDADLEDLLLAEGILHWHLMDQGDTLSFTTGIHSIHYEPCTLRELWLADFWYGWSFAVARQSFNRWGFGRRLLYAAAIWLKPAVRWREILRTPRDAAFFPKAIVWRCALPITITFLIASCGECLGHLFGRWKAPKELEKYELASDRQVKA